MSGNTQRAKIVNLTVAAESRLIFRSKSPKKVLRYHHEHEFARGKRYINGIESFWSFARTRLAKQQGVCSTKFPQHLKGSGWRWNHHQVNLDSLLLTEIRRRPLNSERPKRFMRNFDMPQINYCQLLDCYFIVNASLSALIFVRIGV
jgi:hypothetical protein